MTNPLQSPIPVFSDELELASELERLAKPRPLKPEARAGTHREMFSVRLSTRLMEEVREHGGSVWVRSLILQALEKEKKSRSKSD